MKPSLIVANPTSGQGKGSRVLAKLLERLEAERLGYQVIASDSLASSLAELTKRDLDHFARILVVGGDGMMHHAINEMYSKSTAEVPPIGLIPAGTGNDFARALGLNLRHPERNIDIFLSREPNRVDLGEVNGRRFAAICSTGFDSIVNERANRMRWPKGKRKYDIAMIQELTHFKARHYQIQVDNQVLEVQAMLIAVGNGSSYGGGMKVCPDADLNDGNLDVMILHPVPTLEFLRIFPKVYSGAHIQHPQVQMLKGRAISISGEAVTYADGERIAPTPVSIRSLHNALLTWSVPAL